MSRNKANIPLEVIEVPKPCPADWEAMSGDARVRFCGQCSLHVYNLSAMTRRDAERLVAETEGRLCVRFFRRADGTVITRDCEGGVLLAARNGARRAGRWAKTSAALVLSALLAPLGLGRLSTASPTEQSLLSAEASSVEEPLSCAPLALGQALMAPQQHPPQQMVMGDIGPPVRQQAPMIEVKGEMGEPVLVPIMGAPLPLPLPVPERAPAPGSAIVPVPEAAPATQPATQPATRPASG